MSAIGNRANGIVLFEARETQIGGEQVGAGNVIVASGAWGINVANTKSIAATIQGNLIGTDATGSVALGNRRQGFRISNSHGNVIGGITPGARHVISGNDLGRILIESLNSNSVLGNSIGLSALASAPLANKGYGIFITPSGPASSALHRPSMGAR